MSLDARYILKYDILPYVAPTPQDKDKKYLEEKYGGEVVKFDNYESYYYDKPKYTLLPEDLDALRADQVLECTDNDDVWKIVRQFGRPITNEDNLK